MGLISWIKDTYYNHKLDNADSAYQAKDIVGAERIYQEILDKQPEAAEHLAKMYYEVGKSRNDELSYLAKLKNLLSTTCFGKDEVTSYLNQLVLYIEKVAEQLFKDRDYNKAYKYLKAIDLDKRGDANFAKKSRLYALYVNLNAVEFESSYTSTLSLIDAYCKKDVEQDIEDAIIGTVKRLHESNKLDRAYCTSNCLAQKGNSKAVKECVAVAYDIYRRGKKADINVIDEDVLLEYISQNNRSNLFVGLEQFAKFSDKYRNKYISEGITTISSEDDAEKAFSIFKNVWEISPDVRLIQNFAKPSSAIAIDVYKYFKGHISSLTSESTYQTALFKELDLFEDYNYVLSVLEGLKENGLDNKELYISKVNSVYDSLNDNIRLSLINRLLQNYNDDTWGIREKLKIGERAQATQNYSLSIQLYKELVGLHAKAQPRLAQQYYELSQKESDFKKRRSLIEKAFSFKKTHDSLFDSKEYDQLIPNLNSSVHGLVKECLNNNTPDEAYATVKLFKDFVSDCFDNYIKELKSYHDVRYILSKLEFLKNEGYDVKSDYKEVAINVTSSKDYEDKYKLDILSKAIDLYTDDVLSEKFIQAAIDVVNKESESDGAVSVFAKAWKQMPDSKLLVTFVNQDYRFQASIVDFLIEKTSLPRWKKALVSDFCDQVFSFDDYKYSLSVFDRIAAKGIDVQRSYIASVLKALPSLELDARLSLLNESLAKFSDEYLVIEKLNLSDIYKKNGNVQQVINIYNELIGLHSKAQPRLAQLYYELSQKESDFTKRRSLIEKAFSFKKAHDSLFDSKEYNKLIPNLNSSVHGLVKESFNKNTPDEAYVTFKLFKDFVSDCFDNYIKELKSYHDVRYILSQLESLKNEGYNVKSDYKEVVINVTSSKDYDDKYKLEVLSKSIDLYQDQNLSEKFIKKAINVVENEPESDGAISVFAKAWKQLPNSKLLVAFVNQNYKFHTSIVDFLIEKSSLPRWEQALISDFCDQIFSFEDYKYSLSAFDRIAAKGIDVQKPYVASVLKALPSLDIDERLSLLNESLTKYLDEYLINEKLNLSDNFTCDGKIDQSEKILKELIGLHELAEPKLAELYYKESQTTKVLNCKQKLVAKGLSFYVTHSSVFASKEYESVFKKLLSAYTTIIDKYFSDGEYCRAYQLCEDLKLYSDKWYTYYLKLRTDALSSLDGIEDRINHIRETFSTLDRNDYIVKDSTLNEINSLWDALHGFEVQWSKTKSYTDCVQQIKDYSDYVNNHCNEEKANTLQKEINNELMAIYKSHGYKCEEEGLYTEAISTYIILSSISDIRTKTWCKVRCVLCNIKEGKVVEEEEVRKILAYVGFAKEKKDLAYRYSLYLIANKGAKESLFFVTEYLPEESDLIAACNNEYIKEAEISLGELNQTLERFKNRIATLSEAKKLLESLEEYDSKISPYLSGVHSKIINLRPAIQSYMLLRCYEEGCYDQALKYLKASGKNWYEDDVYFRNVAIACLGIVENGKLNKLNYKSIISCWLTAVYRDQMFVKSLAYTSWDDAYTFTLENSIGGSKYDSHDSLPDNVGYDEPVEGSIISISEVQQSLLDRFEVALNDKDDIFKEFFEEQKDAMDALVKLNMDNPCIIATPYWANTTKKCINEIKDTLDYEYDNYGDENILKVGILYNINTGVYSDYKEAANNAQECVSAAKSMLATKVRGSFIGTAIDTIREFSDLYGSFRTEIQNVLSQITKSGTSYKSVLNVFSVICQALNDNTVGYIFGNYINQSVVGKLNEESLDLASGLKDLVSAYKVAKSCSQLKSNIGNVLEALVGKYITEANASDLATIKSVLSSTGTEFESNIANTLSEQIVLLAMATGHANAINELANIPARSIALRTKLSNLKTKAKEISLNLELSQVVEKVNNNTMSYSSALQKVYSLYKDNKDNDRVCDNLCTLIGMCIREYVIPDKYGKSTVMSIFNELKYNKSSTYRNSATALKKERQDILESLPPQARILLTGGSIYSSELNAEGIKLKNALQLYLDLA